MASARIIPRKQPGLSLIQLDGGVGHYDTLARPEKVAHRVENEPSGGCKLPSGESLAACSRFEEVLHLDGASTRAQDIIEIFIGLSVGELVASLAILCLRLSLPVLSDVNVVVSFHLQHP